MNYLKLNKIVFVGKKNDSMNLKSFSKEIIILQIQQEILTFPFLENEIIFIDCDDKSFNCIEIIKKIRQKYKKIIIVMMGFEKDIETLIEALPLDISAFLQKPLQKLDIEKVLKEVVKKLALFESEDNLQLKSNFSFNPKQLTLFDEKQNLVKLTKYEMKLMQILSEQKNQYISSEYLEHNIWEEASFEQDCNKRLKHLMYCLRKKLPEKTIINGYGLGYKFLTL